MSEVTDGKIVPNITNTTVLVGAGFGGLTDEILHAQRAVEENGEALDRVREWDVVSSS